ncbi:DUF3105 domain-containing protein [Streptomyces colonosanans]|uniref:DUF3105 domain-containing protein n=1 Tax=Streptomyces colonosanans TaxID=1428652 RepID=A0A1S2PW84_9ACTN|nr:DUF3105 domain-containing protein [Streptomyces colonosanans]OIJ98033.1 hypothetical protein BIV24_06590 [Streptomyces colonosanans]
MDSAHQPGTGPTERMARLEEMRHAERVRGRRNRVLTVGAVVVAAGLVVGGVALVESQSGDKAVAASAAKTSDAKSGVKTSGAKDPGHFVMGADGVKTWKGTLGRTHTTKPVAYPMEPPVGGDHHPVWQNCNGDVYTKPVADVHAVHSLEHGAVWVTYSSKASKADVDALAAKVSKTPYTLMSPVEDQKDPLMLSAWAHQRTVKSASDPSVDAFFARFVQGPQTPEPGAVCTGGMSR